MNDDTNSARQRLLDAALEVFATKGYTSASTREICRLAGANIAAIHYYFGDKASLYRQLFERVDQFLQVPRELDSPDTSLDAALLSLYRHLLGFTGSPIRAQRLRALLFREQLQPSGMLSESQLQGLAPFYVVVVNLLRRHLDLPSEDTNLKLLAFSLLGLPAMMMIDQDMTNTLAPEVFINREETAQALAQQALALVQHEHSRRASCNRSQS